MIFSVSYGGAVQCVMEKRWPQLSTLSQHLFVRQGVGNQDPSSPGCNADRPLSLGSLGFNMITNTSVSRSPMTEQRKQMLSSSA
jgi:hypothetical protein